MVVVKLFPMDIYNKYISEDLFEAFTSRLPECCVEIVLENNGEVLVAKRANKPAKGEWFWPGGRLYKGEPLDHAAHRVANAELSIDVDLIRKLGVYSHFWETSAVGDGPSRHTVNIVFHAQTVEPSPTITLDEQHEDYRYLSTIEPDLHMYVRKYLENGNFFS